MPPEGALVGVGAMPGLDDAEDALSLVARTSCTIPSFSLVMEIQEGWDEEKMGL